jgi:DNA-binding transcriptional LysR family regulator
MRGYPISRRANVSSNRWGRLSGRRQASAAPPKGDLTVTAPTILGHLHLLPVALEFLAAYPNIDLRLLLSDHILNLLEDRVDLAIRIGILPDSTMIATRVGTIRRVVCASLFCRARTSA